MTQNKIMPMSATTTRDPGESGRNASPGGGGGGGPAGGRTQLGPALALIHAGRAPTRSALGAGLGVTRATAGAVAAELQALGLIQVDSAPGGAAAAPGRPS